MEQGRVKRLELRQGKPLEADWYLSAVPFERLLDLLPAEVAEARTRPAPRRAACSDLHG